MKYLIKSQNPHDERTFELESLETGEKFDVDIYTDGALSHLIPEGAEKTAESWRKWLGTFVGKTIEVERITPYRYFSGGKTEIVNS
jgi:hypothetical protein